MSAAQLITQCHTLGISLAVKDDSLRLEAQQGVVTDALLAAIRKHKPQVIELLNSQNDMLEAFQERAAIMEYDGGLSREEAEQQAAIITGYTTLST